MIGSISSSASMRSRPPRAYANALGEQDGLLTKLITVVAAPAPQNYFLRHRRFLPEGKSVVLVMVAEHSLDALRAFNRGYKNAETLFDASQASPKKIARACRPITNSPGTIRPCAACASIRRSPICRRSIPSPTSLRR